MKKIIYIFLDIDGVLNNTNQMIRNYKKYHKPLGTYFFNEKNIQKLSLLNKILIKKYEVHYILSSTWRLSSLGFKIAKERLRENGIELEEFTDKEWKQRGQQILDYLYGLSYYRALAIDDDSFDIEPYENNKFKLIKTKTSKGLTYKNIIDFLLKL